MKWIHQHCLALHSRDQDGFFKVSSTLPVKGNLPDTAAFLPNYRINQDTLEIAMSDTFYAPHEIGQGRLPARKVDPPVYLLTDSDRKMLNPLADRHALFDAFNPGSGNPLLQLATAWEQS